MNELALFAGAGGGILGTKLLGWRTVCAVEINSFCARRLMQRQNEGHLSPFPIWDDVCTFDGKPWRGIVNVVSGGFPCQPFSTASRGKKTAKDLWPEMLRIIDEVKPRFVFAENVSNRAIERAADDLSRKEYKTNFIKLSAKDLGADHVRRRYWLFAYANDKIKLHCNINAKMGKLQEFHKSIWESYPGKSRVDDGLANRMERFRAIGNGQIPGVVKVAWEILSDGRF